MAKTNPASRAEWNHRDTGTLFWMWGWVLATLVSAALAKLHLFCWLRGQPFFSCSAGSLFKGPSVLHAHDAQGRKSGGLNIAWILKTSFPPWGVKPAPLLRNTHVARSRLTLLYHFCHTQLYRKPSLQLCYFILYLSWLSPLHEPSNLDVTKI